jgi:ADP-heptose:LPS heptosyltransferase
MTALPFSRGRIVLVLPCCIGDVVLATAALAALRRACPDAHITWAVGAWSRPVLHDHPLLDALLDAGPSALPTRTPAGLWRFAAALRAGRYDALVSLVRSPTMSAAALLSRIPVRAGLDSGGRGFGYTCRARIDPDVPRHEAEIYLDVVRALGIDTTDCRATVPVQPQARERIRARLEALGIRRPPLVINPAGGRNPGMTFDAKRYPPAQMAALAARIVSAHPAPLVLVAGPDDRVLIEATAAALPAPPDAVFAGELSFAEIGALASEALLYLGNDTGLTHLAAAAGGRTAMLLGPTDPRRYAPFTEHALALWKPATIPERGVSAGVVDWDWARDGISVDEAAQRVLDFLDQTGA